jgi:hypothetical protein
MIDSFDLDAAEAEVVRAPFPFSWGGRQWTLLNAFKLDLRLIDKAASGQMDAIQEALRDALGNAADRFFGAPAALDDKGTETRAAIPAAKALNLDAAKILVDRWLDHSGMDPGESPGSSGSSPSTEEPSKPTSANTTKSGSTRRSSAPRKTATRRASSST